MTLQEKFNQMRIDLNNGLIDRGDEIDLALIAMITREHCLLVGPPGTAKSMLLDSLMQWLHGKRFNILLNRFSTPEEVFGPISLRGLKEDRFVRVTTAKLPEAHLAFVDEIFKASSAILNTLLRILNERIYDVGDGTQIKVPLRLAVAASNEWPSAEGGKELAAVFDRFLFRKTVLPIRSRTGLERLLWGTDHTPEITTSITLEEIDEAANQAQLLDFSQDAREAVMKILKELSKEGVQPGDRRKFKCIRACRAAAWLDGSDTVTTDHLEVLCHTLWDDPHEQPKKVSDTVLKIASPSAARISAHLLEVDEILAETKITDLGSSATGLSKLTEVQRKLKGIKRSSKRDMALSYVETEAKKLKRASLETF